MFNFNRRNFLKKYLSYNFGYFVSVFFSRFMLCNNMRFVCEKFYLMGTYGKIQIFVEDIDYGNFVIENVIKRIKHIELLLTKFSPDSDISIINNNPFVYKDVSYDTLRVLKIGNKLSYMTNGFFDMGLGNILSASGIDKTVPLVGMPTTLSDIKNRLLSIVDNKVKLIRCNTMLDLGGIGKGYALDEAIKLFLFYGIKHVAIEFGGDIRVNGGTPSGDSWLIMFNKELPVSFKFLKIHTGSIAISGGYLKKVKKKNSVNHHIINPLSLSSMDNYFFIIVCGKKSIICDALATACYNMDFKLLCKVKSLFLNYYVDTYI